MQKSDRLLDQFLRAGFTCHRKDNEAGMNLLGRNKRSEIPSVLGDNDQIIVDAPSKHNMVRVAKPSEVSRMLCDMKSCRIQLCRQ